MLFRNLDLNGDWCFGSGRENLTERNRAIGLNIRTRLLSWVGDCFFDTEAGIDWVNRLGSKNQETLLKLDVRRIILQSEGVTGVREVQVEVRNRTFSAEYTVQTIYGKEYSDFIKLEL